MTPEQKVLADTMSEISEEFYCAGWLIGLEYMLWEICTGGSREFGMGTLEETTVERLKSLAEACGGWIFWSEEVNGEAWIPFSEWTKKYEEHSRA